MVNAISVSGTLKQGSGTGTTTLAVTPSAVGNLLVVWANTELSGGGTSFVSGLSGGGVTAWSQISTVSNLQSGYNATLWFGKIATAGSATITFTGSGSLASYANIYAAQEFATGGGAGTVWAIDGTQVGHLTNGTNSTTVTFPSLTPSGANRLYVGCTCATGTVSGGTAGYTRTAFTTFTNNGSLWNTSVSAVQSPTCTQSVSGKSATIAGLITGTNATGLSVPIRVVRFGVMARSSYF